MHQPIVVIKPIIKIPFIIFNFVYFVFYDFVTRGKIIRNFSRNDTRFFHTFRFFYGFVYYLFKRDKFLHLPNGRIFFGSDSRVCIMSDIKVLHISNVNATHLVASQPKRNQLGGLRVDLDYRDPSLNGSHYLIQTPKLRLPFGMQVYDKKEDGKESYSLSLSLDNYRDLSNPECEFLKGIKQIDEHIKALAIENSMPWFKKSMKKDVIDELYNSSIKESAEWPPTFRVKLPYYNGKFNCDFYDASRKKCEVDHIVQNCHVIGLVNVSSIWFVNNRFGVQWQLRQLQVFQPPKYDTFMITGAENDEEDGGEDGGDSGRSRSRSPRALQLADEG